MSAGKLAKKMAKNVSKVNRRSHESEALAFVMTDLATFEFQQRLPKSLLDLLTRRALDLGLTSTDETDLMWQARAALLTEICQKWGVTLLTVQHKVERSKVMNWLSKKRQREVAPLLVQALNSLLTAAEQAEKILADARSKGQNNLYLQIMGDGKLVLAQADNLEPSPRPSPQPSPETVTVQA